MVILPVALLHALGSTLVIEVILGVGKTVTVAVPGAEAQPPDAGTAVAITVY